MELRKAVEEVRNELLKKSDFYKAFAKSIESALNECKPYMKESDITEKILDRIIGDE